jgi:hypothetical protein
MNITQADKLVWDTIKSLHGKSSILKEEAKHRLLKEGGVVLISDKDAKAAEAKIRRYQTDHKRLSDSLGTLEANRLINGLNDVAFKTAASRIKDEIGRVETELATLRLQLEGAARSRRWVDWLKSFGEEVAELDSLSDGKKRDYLAGLIKRIDVKYEAEERQHVMLMTLHLPIVNDRIDGKRIRGRMGPYVVVPGTDSVTLVAKKKDGRG